MTRHSMSLEGLWDFSFSGPTARLSGAAHRIRAPGVWQAQLPELRNAHGTGRYRRVVEIPSQWVGRRLVLVLEGVASEAKVFVDDAFVGAHENPWTPCEFDLTDFIGAARTFTLSIVVHVADDRAYERESFGQSLAGKQDWYGIHGGLWKPLRLEARPILNVQELTVQTSTDLQSHGVEVRGMLSRQASASLRLALSRGGRVVAQQAFSLPAAAFALRLATEAAELWSPDNPNLYDLAIELFEDETLVDRLERVVGFRRFEAREGRLILNGAPFYMFGALDQDWYPREESRHPSEAFLEQRFRNAKAMGLNVLRCHVKIPDRLYFDLADRLGLIVWLDMPYSEFLAPTTRARLWETFVGSLEAHGSHPSLCIWTLCNEGWGVDLDDNPDDRRWLKETFDAAKARVPGSLVVDNSPCFPRNYHLKTDIEDFHWYNAFPSQNDDFARTTAEFATRAAWAWSPHGDAVKSGAEPLVCSEFGVWGLPHPSDILEPDGREPWWFESGHDWNQGAAYPHGMETRFRDAQLSPIFGDLDGFVDAAQELQHRGLKYQIETLRWTAPISGYVVTELNDVQWESNGLMDVQNHPRRFADRLANLQRPWLAIARAPRTSIGAGETLDVAVRLAGVAVVPEGEMTWRFGAREGRLPLSSEPVFIKIAAGAVDRILIQNLELEARDASGQALSRNSLEFCLTPAISTDAPALYAADEKAAAVLEALNWPRRATSLDRVDIVLATGLTTPVREGLLAGRKTLLIANEVDSLVDPERALPAVDLHNFPTMGLRRREGTPWDGRWMGAFSWRRVDGPWAALPNGPLLDEHWSGLIPNHVLTGFRSTAFGGLVDAGVAVGWLHNAAAFTKRSYLGKAWITVSTFEMTSSEAVRNPLAPHLLLALSRS